MKTQRRGKVRKLEDEAMLQQQFQEQRMTKKEGIIFPRK